MCFIISQPSPWPLSRERTMMANSRDLVAGIVVQAHHAEHAAGRFLDGDRGHRVLGVVMDELVDHFGADFAHRREIAQPQIVGRYLAQENPDKARRPPASAAAAAPRVPSSNLRWRTTSKAALLSFP